MGCIPPFGLVANGEYAPFIMTARNYTEKFTLPASLSGGENGLKSGTIIRNNVLKGEDIDVGYGNDN
jgi:hypothetical protein